MCSKVAKERNQDPTARKKVKEEQPERAVEVGAGGVDMEVNKIVCGDSLEVMKGIPDESIDLVVTDPPYNISKLNDNRDRSKLNSPIMRRKKSLNYDFGDWDNMDRKDFLTFTKD